MELYTKGVKYARIHDELDMWLRSFDESVRCARYIEAVLKDKGSASDAVSELISQYDTERLVWVLSHTAKKLGDACKGDLRKAAYSVSDPDSDRTTADFLVQGDPEEVLELFSKILELTKRP